MRILKSPFALATAVAAVLAVAGILLVRRGAVDALFLIVVVAGLAGMYKLRRYARARLLYRRDRAEPHPTGHR
ncbi:hypothetical protein [Jidongwangia harbinensis]|uniref:hypothetical protein n=1 Tax=Jidongwangia harbinensis TaxID=2878561 RepID=UPI001CD98697|nr:hypothetical protein [Jidongwangia harbinensis]MCA2218853.1 hypothetical protein [Jidongwangia harbinensis]